MNFQVLLSKWCISGGAWFPMLSFKTLVVLLACWGVELTLREMYLKGKQSQHKMPKVGCALHAFTVHKLRHLLVMTDGLWQPSSGWDGVPPPSNLYNFSVVTKLGLGMSVHDVVFTSKLLMRSLWVWWFSILGITDCLTSDQIVL